MPDFDLPPSVDAATLEVVLESTSRIVDMLDGSTATQLRLRLGELVVEVERAPAQIVAPVVTETAAPQAVAAPGTAAAPSVEPAASVVTAPLMGVFYRRPGPGQEPFVEVGQRVEKGDQVAIVEAMKMMNSVTAAVSGVVRSIEADDGEVVEFEQPLLTIDPSA